MKKALYAIAVMAGLIATLEVGYWMGVNAVMESATTKVLEQCSPKTSPAPYSTSA